MFDLLLCAVFSVENDVAIEVSQPDEKLKVSRLVMVGQGRSR